VAAVPWLFLLTESEGSEALFFPSSRQGATAVEPATRHSNKYA